MIRKTMKNFRVRRVCREDEKAILEFIKNLSNEDKKRLAINRKIGKIKDCIKRENHIFVLENSKGEIMGFIRESGRPEKGAIIEEILIKPAHRGKGYSKYLMELIINKYDYIEAKTLTTNRVVNKLNEKFGFEIVGRSPKGNILYWKMIKK